MYVNIFTMGNLRTFVGRAMEYLIAGGERPKGPPVLYLLPLIFAVAVAVSIYAVHLIIPGSGACPFFGTWTSSVSNTGLGPG